MTAENDDSFWVDGRWECRERKKLNALVGGCALCRYRSFCTLRFVPCAEAERALKAKEEKA